MREYNRGKRRERWRKGRERERGGEETGNTLPERGRDWTPAAANETEQRAGEVERETEREGGGGAPCRREGYRVRRRRTEKKLREVRERRFKEITHTEIKSY